MTSFFVNVQPRSYLCNLNNFIKIRSNKVIGAVKVRMKIPSPFGFPFFGWTDDSVKDYVINKPLKTGDSMIIYNGQAGLHCYKLAWVDNPAWGKQKRVVLSKSGDWGGTTFYRSGKNCFSPTGQSRMLPPIPELMVHLALNVDVWLDT